MIIKIIGHGAVVKKFLHLYCDTFSDCLFQVYLRHPDQHSNYGNVEFFPLDTYTPADCITFCCLSVNEESLLKASASASRLTVAKPNLDLIQQFIHAGFFNHGCHFILTNPSEMIAEFIIQQTGNRRIFALGTSVGAGRYQSILPSFGISPLRVQFTIAGNHYYAPIINFHHYQQVHINLIHELLHALSVKTRSEFTGYKPPISGGVMALHDAVAALAQQASIQLSGYDAEHDAVIAGILNPGLRNFYVPAVHVAARDLHQQTIQLHKQYYAQLTRGFS